MILQPSFEAFMIAAAWLAQLRPSARIPAFSISPWVLGPSLFRHLPSPFHIISLCLPSVACLTRRFAADIMKVLDVHPAAIATTVAAAIATTAAASIAAGFVAAAITNAIAAVAFVTIIAAVAVPPSSSPPPP